MPENRVQLVSGESSNQQPRRESPPAIAFGSVREAVANDAFRACLARHMQRRRDCDGDRIQEVIVRGLIAEAEGRYRPEAGSPMMFLLGIARIVELESRRPRYHRSKARCLREDHLYTTLTPLDDLLTRERYSLIMACVEQLAPEERDLINLKMCRSESPRNTACLNGTERSRLSRACSRIRQKLAHLA